MCFTHLALGGDARDRAQVTLERGGCARCGTGNGEKARDRRDGEKKRLHPRGIQRFIDWHGGGGAGARLKAAIIIIIIISPRVEWMNKAAACVCVWKRLEPISYSICVSSHKRSSSSVRIRLLILRQRCFFFLNFPGDACRASNHIDPRLAPKNSNFESDLPLPENHPLLQKCKMYFPRNEHQVE